MHIERALRQLKLRHAIVEVEDRNAGLAAKANRKRADLQLGTRTSVRGGCCTACQTSSASARSAS